MQTSTAHTIFINTAGQIILRTIDIALGVVTLGFITRYLGQEGFGYYTTVTAFLQLFIVIIDFGLYLTLLREVSAHSDERIEHITNVVFTLRFITSSVFIALAVITMFFLPYNATIKWGVFAMSASVVFSSFITTLTALFQKHLHMVRVAALLLVSRLLLFGLALAIIYYDQGILMLFFANTIALGITFLLTAYLLKKLPTPISLRFCFDRAYTLEVIRKTWPLAITIALNLIYFKADTLILSFFWDQRIVGLYGASYRVLEIISTFPHMFMGLIVPLLTAAWVAQNQNQLELIWRKTFSFFAFLTLPMVAGTFVVGSPLMAVIAGSEFTGSGFILKVLIIATAAIFFGTLYTYVVLVVEQQRRMIKYFAATALFALVGYFLFIPAYSYWGAAWVTVASEVLIVIGAWLVSRQKVQLTVPWAIVGKLAVAALCMAIVAMLLMPLVPLIILIVISAIIYLALSLLFRAVSLHDIRILIKPYGSA